MAGLSVAEQLALALEASAAVDDDGHDEHGPGLSSEAARGVELARQDALFAFLRKGLGGHRAPLRRVFARLSSLWARDRCQRSNRGYLPGFF